MNRRIGLWLVRQEGSTTETREGPCTVKTGVYVFNIAGKSICEALRTVVIREIAGGASGGGAATAGGFGGGVTVPNYFYRVVKYEIGTRYQYEFHVKVKITIKLCPGVAPQSTIEILGGGWVLVGTVPNAICSREILADGIDSPDDAKRIADTNAPLGSGISRSDPDAGLKDQP
ncbi:MAG: hypothetical protein HY607_00720 [Planctomycetes bacterium]|nr:hypothetical protein [Planctomycetota bacterium]